MIRCFVTSTPESENLAGVGRRSARQVLVDSLLLAERTSGVQLIENPGAADVLLFAEWHSDDQDENDAVQRVMRTPEFEEYRPRIVIHSGKDIPRPLIPGLYPSISRRWAQALGCQGAPYLADPNPFLGTDIGWDGRVDRLASFFGACVGKPTRERLLKEAIRKRWSEVLVRDTFDAFVGTRGGGKDHDNKMGPSSRHQGQT